MTDVPLYHIGRQSALRGPPLLSIANFPNVLPSHPISSITAFTMTRIIGLAG